jgi:hypothetical protein
MSPPLPLSKLIPAGQRRSKLRIAQPVLGCDWVAALSRFGLPSGLDSSSLEKRHSLQPNCRIQSCGESGARLGESGASLGERGASLGETRLREAWLWLLLWLTLGMLGIGGCSTQKFLVRRDTPANPLAISLQITSSQGPQISARTSSVLRRYALTEIYDNDPAVCLEELQSLLESEADGELVYSISELAYILGKRAENARDEARALDMYGVAVSNAYMYLFSSEFDPVRNPYDPQFRGACDLYNESLESTLRLVNATGQLHPGRSYKVATSRQTYEVATVVRGNWHNEDFERFEFVSDFKLDGLPSSGLTYGLGVPLIAVRKKGDPTILVRPTIPTA